MAGKRGKTNETVSVPAKTASAPRRRGRGNKNPDGSPDLIDVYVGQRLRTLRMMRSMSQQELGRKLGLTFQQVQKYERGTNRISASRLFYIFDILEVPSSFFYDGAREFLKDHGTLPVGMAENATVPSFDADPMVRRETIDLVRAWYTIDDAVRARLLTLVEEMAGAASGRRAAAEAAGIPLPPQAPEGLRRRGRPRKS